MKFGTKAIHAGIEPDPVNGAIMTAIYQASTFVQSAPGQPPKDAHGQIYEYSRSHNPTRIVLERNLAALENAQHALCFASGSAASDAIIKLLNTGSEVIAGDDLYGGSRRLFVKVFERLGIKFRFVDMTDPENILPYINEKTKMIWLETPTNPLLKITDIAAIAQIAKKNRLISVVDNTFCSPYLQQPLDLGADIVTHSITKYLGGHSDVVMGALMCNDSKLYEDLLFLQNSTGAVPGPMDCFLTLRGIKTLHLRMEQHCKSAEKLAYIIKNHPQVDRVYWPGLADHPNHEIAARQMKHFGGMISFTLKDNTLAAATKLMQAFEIFSIAESLGGVESLANHPATMTHASVPPDVRAELGISDSMIRLSVGVEDTQDLIEDIQRALAALETVNITH